MYVAGLLIIFGAALFWSAPVLLAYAVVFWLATSLFVAAYEEPALARQFGDSYERYRAAVPRWIALRPRR
jgi:protein-S-isoprenylcysteine O-methyltransferase Ste14